MDIAATLQRIRLSWRWMIPILIADGLGMAFGWYYYWDVGQFRPGHHFYEHWAWWPLVGDSPNAVLLFVVAAVLFIAFGWRHKVLDAFAFTLNVYVGLWTTALFLTYPDRMGTWDWGSTNNLLFFAHLGMPLQAFLLWPEMRKDTWSWAAIGGVLAVLTAYIMVDYWGPMLHPAPFLHPRDQTLHIVSPILMVAAAGLWLGLLRPWSTGRATR